MPTSGFHMCVQAYTHTRTHAHSDKRKQDINGSKISMKYGAKSFKTTAMDFVCCPASHSTQYFSHANIQIDD